MNFGRIAAGVATGGLSEAYRALQPRGGSAQYGALPYDNGANRAVDNAKIAAEFQSATGRAPTPNEIDLYGQFIKSGDLEYGDIGNILKGSPEASQSRLEGYTDQFGQRLGAQDNQFLDAAAHRIGAQAQSQFAGLGRPNSSAMAAQVFGQGGQVAQNLAMQRQSALANFYGNGLQNVMGQYSDRANMTQGRAYQKQDSRTDFNRSLLGYQTQRSDNLTDYYNAKADQKRQAFNQFVPAVGGAILGSAGGVQGARLGAQIGGGFGGLF